MLSRWSVSSHNPSSCLQVDRPRTNNDNPASRAKDVEPREVDGIEREFVLR